MMLIQSTAFETGLALIVYFHKRGGKLFFENYGLASLGGILQFPDFLSARCKRSLRLYWKNRKSALYLNDKHSFAVC